MTHTPQVLTVLALFMTFPGQAPLPDATATSPEVIRRLIEKGGKEWSAPKSAQMVVVRVSAGDRYWIWPQEDRVFDVARGNPRLRLSWRLQPGKPPITADEPNRLGIEFMGGSGSSSFAIPGGAEGITEGKDGGTFELVAVDLPKHLAGDGTLTVFIFDDRVPGLAKPTSNLLRLKVRLVE